MTVLVSFFRLPALWLQDASAPASVTGSPAHGSALGDMLHNSGPTALTVLALLLVTSVFSWLCAGIPEIRPLERNCGRCLTVPAQPTSFGLP